MPNPSLVQKSDRVRKFFRTLLHKKSSWGGGAPKFLLFFSGVTALLHILPLFYLLINAVQTDLDRWLKLLDARIPGLLWNTLSLAALVTLGSVIIGFSLSWLVERSDIPAKKFWYWLFALPMVIPPYVGGMCYISVFGPRGLITELAGHSVLDIYGFWGAAFVLIMFAYPYVYLISLATLRRINTNYEEAGRSLGLKYSEVFRRIIVPMMRPAIGAGAILVALYVLSDFGTVTMLRYTTFTSTIYFQVGSFDQNTASILSSVLIVIALAFLLLENRSRKKQEFFQTTDTYQKSKTIHLGKWKVPALIFVLMLFLLAVIIPFGVLVYWSIIGINKGALNAQFWGFALNSFLLSLTAALFSIAISLPIIYLNSRYPSRISSVIEKASYAGFCLPGVVIALGILYVFNNFVPVFYNTVAMIVIAYVIRFLPKSLQAEGASLQFVTPRLDEAGRSLGCKPWQVLLKIILPIILPGIKVAAALVFVSSIKELPATLLLRPPGLDTLAIRVWTEASEYYFYLAAPSALLIVLISVLPLKWLFKKEGAS